MSQFTVNADKLDDEITLIMGEARAKVNDVSATTARINKIVREPTPVRTRQVPRERRNPYASYAVLVGIVLMLLAEVGVAAFLVKMHDTDLDLYARVASIEAKLLLLQNSKPLP
jgi:hypothetical protein